MQDIVEELTCTVCLEIYREPQLLPCGHSFCLQCLRDLRRVLDFRCPECRQECRKLEDIRKNHKLANIVDVYLTEKASRAQMYVDHSEKRVVYWLLLTAVLLLFTAALVKHELDETAEELLDSQLQLLNLQNEDSVMSTGLMPAGFGRTVLNFLLSLLQSATWLILGPFVMLRDLLWWLFSTTFYILYLFLWLISSSLGWPPVRARGLVVTITAVRPPFCTTVPHRVLMRSTASSGRLCSLLCPFVEDRCLLRSKGCLPGCVVLHVAPSSPPQQGGPLHALHCR
ncbi:Tripartite motif-containing protein 65-like [Arapaima gigas]